jgi:hypothetical protein
VIASVPQIGVQPAPAKLPSAGASPISFSQVMEQHQASVHGMPDPAKAQNPSDSKPAAAGASKAASLPLKLATDLAKTDKKADDSQGNPKQDSQNNTGSNTLLAQIVASIPAPVPPPAPPTPPAEAVNNSSTAPVTQPAAIVGASAFGPKLPSAHFVNAFHEGLSTKLADVLPSSKPHATVEDGKTEGLPENTDSVDTIPSDAPDDGPKALSSDTARPAPDPNALVASTKVAAAAKPLSEEVGVSQSKSASPIDISQQSKNEKAPNSTASKPDKENGGVDAPQTKAASAPSQSAAVNSVNLSSVLAAADPASPAKAAEIKELKLPAVVPQPTSNPKQALPSALSTQATPQAPTSKDANAAHAGKEEKKDDDSGETLQDTQQVPTDTPKDLAAPQPNSSFSHVVTQATNVKDHTLQSSSNDVVPGALVHLHAAETPAPESASAALLHSRILQRIGQSELRVGIQAGEFGTVDIRTSMSRNQVTAEISVDHGELGRMLAAELPSLQNKLAEHHIPPASLVLQTQTSGSFADSGQRSGNWHRTPPAQNVFNSYAGEQAEGRNLVAPELSGTGSGLDIHM